MSKPVLIVEDDPDMREVITDVVASGGYPTVTAWNGEEALEKLKTLKKAHQLPGLILLDLMMPVMDGQTFIEKLQGGVLKGLEYIPIVIMSAMATEIKGHVEAYLMKPPKIDSILNMAEEFCEE